MLHSKSILAVNFISSYQSSPSIALDELCPCWYVTVLACKLLSPHVFLGPYLWRCPTLTINHFHYRKLQQWRACIAQSPFVAGAQGHSCVLDCQQLRNITLDLFKNTLLTIKGSISRNKHTCAVAQRSCRNIAILLQLYKTVLIKLAKLFVVSNFGERKIPTHIS